MFQPEWTTLSVRASDAETSTSALAIIVHYVLPLVRYSVTVFHLFAFDHRGVAYSRPGSVRNVDTGRRRRGGTVYHGGNGINARPQLDPATSFGAPYASIGSV